MLLPGDCGEIVPFQAHLAPPRKLLGGRLQVQSRHCGLGSGAGRVCARARRGLCLPLPRPERGPCVPAALPGFLSPLRWCGLERKRRALQGSAARIWQGVGRGPGFPSTRWLAWLRESFSQVPSSSTSPGRLRPARRRRHDRQPRHRRHLGRCAKRRALGGSLARSREAGRAPRGQALLGRKPQLTQAARKAEAAPLGPLRRRRAASTWGPDGRAEAPEGGGL